MTAAGDPVHADLSDQLEAWEWQRMLAVLRVVSRRTGVSYEDLLGRSRLRDHTEARHLAQWALRNNIGLSWRMIAWAFGRDHTSVVEAVKALFDRSRTDGELRERMNGLAKELTS